MNTFQYKGRKAEENHIVPRASFRFDDGGKQRSKRPRPLQLSPLSLEIFQTVRG